MKRLAITMLALATLTTAFVASASAAPPSDTNQLCRFTWMSDPHPDAPQGRQTGFIDGGPILQNGTITCTIQIGGLTHADADNGVSVSATGTHGVTYLAPTPVSFDHSSPDLPIAFCAEFVDDGGTVYYWDEEAEGWAEGDATVRCEFWSSDLKGEIPGPVTDLFDTLAAINDTLTAIEQAVVDPQVCPVFATVRASGVDVPGVLETNAQGDVFLAGEPFWDCPPYDLFG